MPDNNAEQLFAQLDDVRLDPYTVQVMEQAAEIEALINDDSEADELTVITVAISSKEAIERMDLECPHLGEPVVVTGRLKQSYYDEVEGRFELEDVEVDRVVLISHGYRIIAFGTIDPDRSIKKVGHLFLREQMGPQNDAPALVDYIPRLFAFAPVGQVNIEYDRDVHDNNVELQKIIPEILKDIDGRILDTPDVCSALLSLADMTISENQDIPKSALLALQVYVNKRLIFDTIMPYRVQFSGPAYNDRPDEELKTNFVYDGDNTVENVVVSPDRLSLRTNPTVAGDGTVILSEGELHWCIDLAVHDKSADVPDLLISVPVKNILSFQSVRQMLFGDHDTVQ